MQKKNFGYVFIIFSTNIVIVFEEYCIQFQNLQVTTQKWVMIIILVGHAKF